MVYSKCTKLFLFFLIDEGIAVLRKPKAHRLIITEFTKGNSLSLILNPSLKTTNLPNVFSAWEEEMLHLSHVNLLPSR